MSDGKGLPAGEEGALVGDLLAPKREVILGGIWTRLRAAGPDETEQDEEGGSERGQQERGGRCRTGHRLAVLVSVSTDKVQSNSLERLAIP